MTEAKSNRHFKIRTAALFAFAGLMGGAFFYSYLIAGSGNWSINAEARASNEEENRDYNKFPHEKHKKQACDKCHVFPSPNWKDARSEPFPDVTEYPRHSSCLSCHRRQFFSSASPAICSICHTDPSPRNGKRHPFPNPREVFDVSVKGKSAISHFRIYFPHDSHMELLGEFQDRPRTGRSKNGDFVAASFQRRRVEESCAMCHQTLEPQGNGDGEYLSEPPKDLGDRFWLKKGTFMSVPTSHASCFSCHSEDTGILPAPKDCGTCHKPADNDGSVDFDAAVYSNMKIEGRQTLIASGRRKASGTFRHEWFSHAEMECSSCHSTDRIDTLGKASGKVNIASCGICHITETSDDGGILNFEVDSKKSNPGFQCVKCHITFGKQTIPKSHFDAIKAQSGN